VTTEVLEPSGAEDREAAMCRTAARGFDPRDRTEVHPFQRRQRGLGGVPGVDFACIDHSPRPDGERILPNVAAAELSARKKRSFPRPAVAGPMTRTRHRGFEYG
jgi:basic membrane protein A